MNFLPLALRSLTAALGLSQAAPPAVGSPPGPCPQAEDRRWGCGWFDSSIDLQQGLQLHELSSPDQLAAELPLAFWLQIDLADCSAAGCA